MFGTTLQQEYVRSAQAFGLSRQQIVQLCKNAIRYSFLSDDDKEPMLRALQVAAQG
jgi:adenosine deaminase